MAKSRKARKATRKSAGKPAAKKTKRRTKAKRAVPRKSRRARTPKRSGGIVETMVGSAQDAAVLRQRLAGRETFED
jgi:hypothetical protein